MTSHIGAQSETPVAGSRGPRVSKADQSAETRRRIVLAAVECLAERGFAGTTLQVIAERMSMSRTPIHYHFSTRLDLFVEVARRLPTVRAQQFGERLEGLHTFRQRMKAIVVLAKSNSVRPEHLAAIELKLAARSDTELGAQLLPVIESAEREGEAWWINFLAADEEDRAMALAFRQLVLGLARSTIIDESIGLTPDPTQAWGLIEAMLDTFGGDTSAP